MAQLSRRSREDGVFRFIHSGSRFQKVAVSEAETLVHERLRVDETAKRLETCAVSPEIVSVWMWPQSAVASVLFYAAVCWGGSVMDKDAKRWNKLVKKDGSLLGGGQTHWSLSWRDVHTIRGGP